MTRFVLSLGSLWVATAIGCAASPPARTAPMTPGQRAERTDGEADHTAGVDNPPAAVVASALVFRSPVTAHDPPLELSRAPRMPSAFVGFEDPITESYQVSTYDRQAGGYPYLSGGGWGYGNHDRYERTAVIEKFGVLHR